MRTLDDHAMYVMLAVATALVVGLWLGIWIGETRTIETVCANRYIRASVPEACG